MLSRPLAPFRVRPVKPSTSIRKVVAQADIHAVAAELPAPVRASRKPVKSTTSRLAPALRIIER